jgi:molybdate-binding protein
MTTHAAVARDLAGRVAAGDLVEGDAIPSIRPLAVQSGASQATVQRAFAVLAAAGVITTAARRAGTVAPGGSLAARRFLRGAAPFRLAGTDDPALALLRAACGDELEVRTMPGGTAGALAALAHGDVDGATLHLQHVAGGGNALFARAALADRQPTLVHLWQREYGLLVAPGNPHRVRGGADLAGLRIARRPLGAGHAAVLATITATAGVELDAADPEAGTATDVAIAVATGEVDAGVGPRSIARRFGLAFVALGDEAYEIAVAGAELGGLEPLLRALRDPALRARIIALGGYDLALAGEISPAG